MTPSANRSLVFQLLERFCAQRGFRLAAADPYGHAGMVESPSGKRWFFKGTRFDLNSLGASEIANDKAYAAKFLDANGIPVPRSHFVLSSDLRNSNPLPGSLLAFTDKRNFPLYVKPNIGQEGRDVSRVENTDALRSVLEALSENHDHLLVQEEVRGKELRIVVLEGEVLCVIERQAPSITADGRRSIAELLEANGKLNPDDQRIAAELAAQGMTLESVPASGKKNSLLPIANLSSGGTASMVTEEVAPRILSLARKAASTLSLRYAGVDLIVPEGTGTEAQPIVLEVNAAPGLSNLHRQGTDEARLVEEIYEKVFSAMFVE